MIDTSIEIKWYGYPIRFYIDKLEFPWISFSAGLVLIYIWSLSTPLSYLGFLAPISLVGEIVTVAVAAYLLAGRQDLPLPVVLVYGGMLGFTTGFVSAFLAFFRFWYIWLFFNIVVESITAAVFGLAIALVIYYLRRLPFWPKKINN